MNDCKLNLRHTLDACMLLALSLFLAVLQVDGGGLIDSVAVMVVTPAITNGWPGHSLASEPLDTSV